MKAPPGNRRPRNTRRTSKAGQKRQPQCRIQEILVPVDFSDASRQALIVAGHWAQLFAARLHHATEQGLPRGCHWAQLFAARLHLLYVIEPPTLPQWGYVFLALREGKLRKEAEEQLKKLRQSVPAAVAVTTEVRSGYGAEYEICQLARKRKTDLIVTGSHGAGPIRRALMGSTAEQVVRHAPCPVLVVRGKIQSKASRA